MVDELFLREVETPVCVEVAAGDQRAQAEHGLGALEAPAGTGDVHPIPDQVATRPLDDAVPKSMADALGLPVRSHDLVLEGGSIETNGAGTLLTTEQCLLHPNRNPHLTRDQIEAELRDALGVTRIVWLPGGIIGDDTDGHIDDLARFVAPDRVVCVAAPPGHDDHDVTRRNLDALRQATDPAGRPFDVIELPAPEPILYDFPPDRFGPGGREPVPASYANFLLANRHCFVPVFNQPRDETACRVLESALPPGFTIVPVRADRLVVGLGALHCLSMQQPAV